MGVTNRWRGGQNLSLRSIPRGSSTTLSLRPDTNYQRHRKSNCESIMLDFEQRYV